MFCTSYVHKGDAEAGNTRRGFERVEITLDVSRRFDSLVVNYTKKKRHFTVIIDQAACQKIPAEGGLDVQTPGSNQ
jgi:hypothetical protein